MDGLSAWWDSMELWLAQLWFPLQFLIVIAVVLPVCALAAWVIDRVVGLVASRFGSARRARERPEPPS
ncbi:hypothetical protein [Amycolatopsis antarctica]|uniref:hypothetical protein n=1 Tax=Amycolatopsis antarctica TaxID=1854586 RepID=UPI001F0ABC64|nr:hypothetical protein [Amycolatopsis antarctica]